MKQRPHRAHRALVIGLGGALLALATPSSAQFNDQWVSFSPIQGQLGVSSTALTDGSTEADMAWGDVDDDGDTDVVVVRKQEFTSTGKRTNFLLRNDNATLNNATSLVTDSDVGGDQGFLTPTNDRDVILVDVDNDGTLDIVTATTLSDNDPKHIGHPRIYRNKGGVGAAWLGYRFEAGRSPQLFHFGNGQARNPRFCSVAGGDVTNDGFADLYFGDYDSSGAGGSGQPGGFDLDDRLWVNDGTGFFSDDSQLRMTSQMLDSAFGNSVIIHDFNQDGFNDIVKDTSLNAPQYVAASYNNPNNPGFFNIFHSFHTNAPYHVSEGDLNNDGRTDLIISDDASDRIRINTGVDALGRVTWSSALTFDFISGGDDGFASNNLVTDLDNDGWNDVLICDVDVDIGGCSRRLHIYHNETTQVGAASNSSVTLIEERESTSNSGWIGVVGLTDNTLEGAHDVAVFDLDGDGDKDLLLARCAGTFLYENDLGGGGPGCGSTQYGPSTGSNIADINSDDTPSAGSNFTFDLSGFNGNGTGLLVISTGQANSSAFGGTLLVNLAASITGAGNYTNVPLVGGSGSYTASIPAPAVGVTVYCQAAMLDASQPAGLAMTNGLTVTVCP